MTTKKTSETSGNSKNVKKRHWAFVLYPESAPADWLEQLSQKGVPVAISPLHDKDLNPTGEPKKAHFHVILSYSGPTSFNVIKGITDSLNQPIPQALEQVRGYYRYLTHMDNPEKAQYDAKGITHLCGFNIADYTDLTKSELTAIKLNLIDFIEEHNIGEYYDFIKKLRQMGMMAEFEIASTNTYFYNAYIKSKRHSSLQAGYGGGSDGKES